QSEVILWDARTGELKQTLPGVPMQSVYTLAFSPDSQSLATAGAEPISQIYVAGGAGRTPGLLDLLREEFQMQVEELNAFNRVGYNPGKFSDDFIRERAPRLAVSVGLALRSFDEA
ncbi:MAG: pilus assembly protein PilM, partial [Acidobacteria bacterium]|nr:pilus assembly protein PilM [Acidobacteriota bacterium]